MEAYNLTDAISKSGLDKIDSSPLDFWWHYLRPERDPYTPDKQTLFDNAFRMSVFNPAGFRDTYVKMPAIKTSTNLGKAELAALTKTIEGKNQLLLPASDFDTILAMQEAVMKHPTAKILCGSGSVGIPNRFIEENTGATVKFLPHWIHNREIIVHLMSAKDASVDTFTKEAREFRYDKKAALQMDGLKLDGMSFVQVENKAPYKIGIFYLDDRTIAHGRANYIKNCTTYMQCRESGKWPGYPVSIQPITFPEWFLNK